MSKRCVLFLSLLVSNSAWGQTVSIGVLGLFHPREVTVAPAAAGSLVIDGGAEHFAIENQSVRMRLGNAGGVDVSVNGVSQGRLGSTGQALDVSWSRG